MRFPIAPQSPNRKTLAWLLASYARDGLARVEATGDAESLEAVRSALEEALGIRFEGEKGARFFRSTLVQTLFYGIFSAWVLWARQSPSPTGNFDWRTAVWHLRVPVLRALFQQTFRSRSAATAGPRGGAGTGHPPRSTGWTGPPSLPASTRARLYPISTSRSSRPSIPSLRKQLGVWYTPTDVVRYMVARVDKALKDDLGIADGLAGRECLRA